MISVGLNKDDLTESQKNWFAVAICGAILADGNVAIEELEYLEKALTFLGSQDKVNALVQAVKEQKLPELEKLPDANRGMEARILLELALVIGADDHISTREMDYLFTIARKLGYEKEFTQIVMRWVNEGILWRRKLEHLIKVGTELEAEYE